VQPNKKGDKRKKEEEGKTKVFNDVKDEQRFAQGPVLKKSRVQHLKTRINGAAAQESKKN